MEEEIQPLTMHYKTERFTRELSVCLNIRGKGKRGEGGGGGGWRGGIGAIREPQEFYGNLTISIETGS